MFKSRKCDGAKLFSRRRRYLSAVVTTHNDDYAVATLSYKLLTSTTTILLHVFYPFMLLLYGLTTHLPIQTRWNLFFHFQSVECTESVFNQLTKLTEVGFWRLCYLKGPVSYKSSSSETSV